MKILAVTSCPVGAAHTYMAAAALEKGAKKTGNEIKVETQGSLGYKNKLSAEDIAGADVLILACDITCLEKERFKDITTLEVSTKKCIKDSVAIIEQALAKAGGKNE
jgi:PTS system fructose-specific IIB component/fructose-specific PTS system IIB-like component